MSIDEERPSEFERRSRALLEESVTRLDGRIRSRLAQARHAALEQADRRAWHWRRYTLLPAAGAAAAAILVAFMLWTGGPLRPVPAGGGAPVAFEDLELLADREGLELLEEWDAAFFEWAAAQSELGEGGRG